MHYAGTVSTGEDDPFFKPKEREAAEQEKEKQGFGWFGKTLEDGVYEIEDDDHDAQMGVQHEGAEGDPHQRVLPEGPGDGELEEIEIEGEKYNKRSSLRKLREGLRLYGLPKGRSKDDAWRRLVTHHNNLAENLGVEIARREFERRKQDEGGDGVRGQVIPLLPIKAERQLHELCHWPYETWCQHCVASRGKLDPHHKLSEVNLRAEAKSEFPVASMDFALAKSLKEPEEEDREEIRRHGGDQRMGVSLVVTDDWTRGVLVLPVPGKGRMHAKYLAEQVVRYIGSCGFSTCTVKADAEPSTRLLLDIIQKCRQKLGFKTMIEHSGPDDSQGNGRVEREIQTARGLARSLVSQLTENAKVEINVYGPIYQWAMRHAGWLLSHYRRQSGSPTAYEMVSGRKYIGKLAMFGERVLARLPTANGENRFKTGVWVGKTDRADFHIVFTEGGLRWTRTIRRLPVPFEAEALTLVKAWPWSVSFGQIGAKQSALMTKVPGLALPPDMAPAIRAEEAQERRRVAGVQAGGEQEQQAGQDRHQRQAGLQDEAASDPSSTSSSSGSADKGSMDDDTLLADLLAEVNEDKTYEGGVETPPSSRGDGQKRDGEEIPEEDQSPSKAARETSRKAMRSSSAGVSGSSTTPIGAAEVGPLPAGDGQVRMVVVGEVLEDGDQDLEFPDKPPELSPDEMFEVEAQAAEKEVMRLIDMGVLVKSREGQSLENVNTLTTKMVLDWRKREGEWTRRARLVARDYAWIDPNRTDVFAPAGGQSLIRIIPALAQLNGCSLKVLDVKDAYLMCPQPREVKVTLDQHLAQRLGVQRDWMLGRVLPGQREGAAEWFSNLKQTLKEANLVPCAEAPTVWSNKEKTVALLIHVDDIAMTGTDEELEKLTTS